MAEIASVDKMKEIVLFLGTAGVLMPLVKRVKFSPTLGFLAAGIVLGPFVMGSLATDYPWMKAFSFSSADEIRHIGEFGVVFLFFMIGLELSLERVRIMRKAIFGLGASQFLISAAIIGLVAWWAGAKPVGALVIGAALAMSSTAIVVPALAEMKQLSTPCGRSSFAILLFQDLAVTPVLIMVAMLATAGDSGSVEALWKLATAALGLAALILVGRLVLRPLFQSVALAGSHEFFMAACLLVVVGAALVAGLAGLSMAIGAFVGGLLLAETEFRRQIEATIEPFQGLLLGLFFIAIGAQLDLSLLSSAFGQIIVIAVVFVAIKAAVLYAIMKAYGVPLRSRHLASWLLSPGGEFAFVLLAAGAAAGLVFPVMAGKLMVAVTLTMFAIPVFAALVTAYNTRNAAPAASFDTPDLEQAESRVVVVGGGRVGQMVIEMLARHKVPTIAVDTNQRNVEHLRGEGFRAYYGDPTSLIFLEKLGLDQARALVLTVSNPATVDLLTMMARKINPKLTIVARARDRNHAQKLYEMGVSDAVPETFEASLQLAESVLVDVGVPMGQVIASVHDKREKTRRRLKAGGQDAPAPVSIRRLQAGE